MVSRHDKEIRIIHSSKGAAKQKRELKAVDKNVKKLASSQVKAGKSADFMRIKTSGLRRQLGAVRNQLLIVAFMFGGLIAALNKAVQAYKRQFQAEQQLIAGLRNVKGSTIEATRALINYAGELQKITTFSDENTISGMAMLATFQLNAAAIKEITPRMLDMAAAAQIAGASEQELKSVAIALGKGLTGQVGMLTRYGVIIDKIGLAMARAKGKGAEFIFVLEQLDQNFKGIAEQLATSTIGELIRLENQLSDIGETIGRIWAPVLVTWAKIKLAGAETISFLIQLTKELTAGGKGLNEAWQAALDTVLGLRVIEDIDLGDFRLPPDLIIELAKFNKQFAYSLELAKQRALLDDGIIDQKEQLGLLDLQRIHLNDLLNRGLLEEIDYWTQITQLNNQMIVVTKKLFPEQQIQIDMIRQFGSAMAQAAIDGQNMGKAVVSAIKAIAAQILAELAIFALAKFFNLDLSLLMAGGGTITKFVGGVLGIGKSVSTLAPVSAPVQTQIINQNTFLILDDQQGIELQLLLNRVSANA